MAILKQITFKGLPISYWKIASFVVDAVAGKTTVRLAVYATKAARDASVSNVIEFKSVQLKVVDKTRAELYALIMAMPVFAGSVEA